MTQKKMAEALSTHWGKVFGEKPIDRTLMERWFASLRPQGEGETNMEAKNKLPDHGNPLTHHQRAPRRALPQTQAAWTPRKQDAIKALKLAGNSSPGPDGIPFAAWRRLGELGVSTLHEVALALRKNDALEAMVEAQADICDENQHHYNLSTLVCLPKTASGDDMEFGAFFKTRRYEAIINCKLRQ